MSICLGTLGAVSCVSSADQSASTKFPFEELAKSNSAEDAKTQAEAMLNRHFPPGTISDDVSRYLTESGAECHTMPNTEKKILCSHQHTQWGLMLGFLPIPLTYEWKILIIVNDSKKVERYKIGTGLTGI
ncbi:MAG: hypothetical protein HC868_17930 [Sphingomonadales bacterium]|nr:hypothetical protein [Sphingomonadales bacterium]